MSSMLRWPAEPASLVLVGLAFLTLAAGMGLRWRKLLRVFASGHASTEDVLIPGAVMTAGALGVGFLFAALFAKVAGS